MITSERKLWAIKKIHAVAIVCALSLSQVGCKIENVKAPTIPTVSNNVIPPQSPPLVYTVAKIFSISGETPIDKFGRSVTGGIDFNDDGVDDILVGAPGFQVSDIGAYVGRVEIRSGINGDLLSAKNGATQGGFFGEAISRSWSARQRLDKSVFILSQGQGTASDFELWNRSSSFISSVDKHTGLNLDFVESHRHIGLISMSTVQTGPANLGIGLWRASYSEVGDLDGDSIVDEILGVMDVQQNAGGLTFIRNRTHRLIANLSKNFASNGTPVGDWNHDGTLDFAIGQPTFNNEDGRVLVIDGRAPRGDIVLDTFKGDIDSASGFGFSLDSGDFDGDGFQDIVVGAPYRDISTTRTDIPMQDAGKVYIFSGKTRALMTTMNGERTLQGFGCSVGSAGRDAISTADRVVVGSVAGCSGLPMGTVGSVSLYRIGKKE